MLGLELVVVLGVCVLASSVASGRLRLAAPVLLVVCGAVLGFVPSLESVSLPPEAMLLIFLPALLYWESLTGLLCAWLAVQVRRRLDNPIHESVVSVLTPFTAFLLNGALFVLIGLQAHGAVRALDPAEILFAAAAIGLVALTVVGTRGDHPHHVRCGRADAGRAVVAAARDRAVGASA